MVKVSKYVEFKSQVLYLRKQWRYKADRGTFHALLFVCSWINLWRRKPFWKLLLECAILFGMPPVMC